jgi:hypothetical protein
MNRRKIMRKLTVSLIVSTCLMYSNSVLAQGEASLLFLKISPSPLLNGMGQVGAALPNTEAYGFYYNPAQLGNSSRTVNVAFQFYPSRTNWLPGFNFGGPTYDNLALNLGYNFKNRFKSIPLSVGLGYMRGVMDYGENVQTDDQGNILGVFSSKESFNAFGFGIGTEFYVRFSAGLTYKKINSKLSPVQVEKSKGVAKTDALDFGVLLTVPILKYFENSFLKKMGSKLSFLPYFDISLGYARTNIGDKVAYIDRAQADPIPRTAHLGYALSGGVDFNIKDTFIRIFGFDWSVDARDLLVNRDGSYKKGLLGEISFGANLLAAKSDENVDIHKGSRLQFFDFIEITSGSLDGEGSYNPKTSGFGLNAGGVLKIISAFSENKTMQYIADHFNLRYAHSETDYPSTGTTYQSILFVVSGY